MPAITEPVVRAYVWYCGDEVCDCREPLIEVVAPGPIGRAVRRTVVWRGTFTSGADYEELPAISAELEAEASRRRIPLGDTPVSALADADLAPGTVRRFAGFSSPRPG